MEQINGDLKLSSNHIALPASVAIPAILCYYDKGPRYNEGGPAEEKAPPEETMREEEIIHESFPPGWKPKGFAAAKIKEHDDHDKRTETSEEA